MLTKTVAKTLAFLKQKTGKRTQSDCDKADRPGPHPLQSEDHMGVMIHNNRLWNALAPDDIRYIGHPDIGERDAPVRDGRLGICFVPVRYAVLFLMGREVSKGQAPHMIHIPPGTDRDRVSVCLIEEPPPSRRIEHHRRASERRLQADAPASEGRPPSEG